MPARGRRGIALSGLTMSMPPMTAAVRPTMYFIGVTTGSSSIMRVFPRWARLLDLGDCELKGVDVPIRAPAAEFRGIVEFVKNAKLRPTMTPPHTAVKLLERR